MSTSVYTGREPVKFYSQELSADLIVRCVLYTLLLQIFNSLSLRGCSRYTADFVAPHR
jgi:hypothetical protein